MRHPTQLHSGGVDWTRIRILVYSLDDAFRFLTRQTFRKLNVREVLSTSVAADASQMMGQCPDIALVDVDGDVSMAMAFLKRVRAADADMPVLMVAKADDRALIAEALPLGIEGFVPKPVSGHELSHRVGDSLIQPRRIPVPAPKAPDVPLTLENRSTPTVATGGGPSGADLKSELAALTRRLGQSAGSAPHGGTGHGGTGHGGKMGGGLLVDTTPPKKNADTYADDGPPQAMADKGSGGKPSGSYYDEPPPSKPKAATLEAVTATLPESLRPKRRKKEEAAEAEAARQHWLDELAKLGHRKKKDGKDVAGLDVDAIVATHVLWLTTQGAEGKRADFAKMDLAGAGLAGTVLANAGFRGADLSDAQLAEARLDGADLRQASLSAADLSGADLGVAQLRHADLRLANLQGASLRGADLSGARLRGAKLDGADFKGATLVGSELGEADLSKVENLTQAQMDKAICDMKTKLPPGVFRPRKDED
jgi:CheY-like chemotaxis protein